MITRPLNDTLYIIKSINEGREFNAFSSLGLNSKINLNQIPGATFIAKVMGISAMKNNNYESSILTESFDKSFDFQKNTVANVLDLHYILTESISMAVANSISSLSVLSENNDPLFSENGMDNIKDTLTEGVIVMRDALENVFSGISALNKKARAMFSDLLGEDNIYAELIPNAIMGANTLLSIDKIVKYKDSNMKAITEATNSFNASSRADDILYSVLSLQENLIKMFNVESKFNRELLNIFNENNTNFTSDVSNYIATSLDQIAIPLMESDLNSNDLSNAYNTAITSISALYDQYIQDCVA